MNTPEGSLEAIDTYFTLIRSDEITDLREANGMLDDVLHRQGPYTSTHEVHTGLVIGAAEDHFGLQPDYGDMAPGLIEFFERDRVRNVDPTWAELAKSGEQLKKTRVRAVSHVVRAMIQGEMIATEDFDYILVGALSSASLIEGNNGSYVSRVPRRYIKGEINEVGRISYLMNTYRERAVAAKMSFRRAHRFGKIAVKSEAGV